MSGARAVSPHVISFKVTVPSSFKTGLWKLNNTELQFGVIAFCQPRSRHFVFRKEGGKMARIFVTVAIRI